MKPESKIVFTLGADSRTEEDFVEILNAYDIQCLIDVRRFPTSKLQQFKRENLQDLLASNGIEYRWLGAELGGFRKGGYAAYAETDEFKAGIGIVESIAAVKSSVILCSERFPWKCHRRWIARELHRRGRRIEHILDKGKVWVPKD